MEVLVDIIENYAKEHPKGFTLNINTLEPVTKGISVAYRDTQNGFGREGIRAAIEHASEHWDIVGGWLAEDGRYYFDSIKVFDNMDKAVRFAEVGEQIAMYDLTNDRLIPVISGNDSERQKQQDVYTIYNTVEGKDIFQGTATEFIEFMELIARENEDFGYFILGLSDAIEYIEDYCDNLQLEKQ